MAKSPPPTPQWEELIYTKPDPAQLDKIKAQLDLVLLALKALTGIGPEAILQAATHLNLESRVPALVALWQQQPSNSLHQGEAGQQKLDVETARTLVLISSYLAKQHQELIRRAVTLLEQQAANNRDPHDVALLGDYINTFSQIYQERWLDAEKIISMDVLHKVALKLLVELLFYSAPGGHRRLWLVLLDRLV